MLERHSQGEKIIVLLIALLSISKFFKIFMTVYIGRGNTGNSYFFSYKTLI